MGKRVKRTSVKNSFGFTIVETLIVLAVTGLLMLSIIALINGKQKTTAFQTAINNVRGEMQQISSDVATGSFPDSTSFGCQNTANTVLLNAAPDNGGACTFIGKAIHFEQHGDGSNDVYSVYSMVGLKNDASTYRSNGVAPFLAAKTSPGVTQNLDNAVGDGITTSTQLQNGLSVRKVSYTVGTSPTATTISSFAFLQSLNPGLAGTTSGGSQHDLVMAFTGASGSQTNNQDSEAYAIDQSLHANSFVTDPPVTVTVCLQSGTTNQWATLTITSADVRAQILSVRCDS